LPALVAEASPPGQIAGTYAETAGLVHVLLRAPRSPPRDSAAARARIAARDPWGRSPLLIVPFRAPNGDFSVVTNW
jgi:hypothetical protein